MQLYPYQQEAVHAIQSKWQAGVKNLLLAVPTGGGKTLTFASILRNVMEGNETRALIMAHRDELLNQAKDKIETKVWAEAQIGMVTRHDKDFSQRITIGSVQTLARNIDKLPGFDYCVVDEAHHAFASQYRAVLKKIQAINPSLCHLGATATAIRTNRREFLSEIYDDVGYSISLFRLIQEGYLVGIDGYGITTSLDLRNVRVKRGDYDERALGEAVSMGDFNASVVDGYLHKAAGKKAICFCVDVAHIHALEKLFRDRKVKAQGIDGKMPLDERRRIIADFRLGRIEVLLNVKIGTEGYDEPSIEVVLMARPTKSIIVYTQCVGRGLRLFPGKAKCVLLDFTDSSSDIGLMTLKDLISFYELPSASKAVERYAREDRPLVIDRKTIPGLHMLEELGESGAVRKLDLFDVNDFAWSSFDGNHYVAIRKNFSIGILKDPGSPEDSPLYNVYLCYVSKDNGWFTQLNSAPTDYSFAQGVCNGYLFELGDKTFAHREREWMLKEASVAQKNYLHRLYNVYKSLVNESSVRPLEFDNAGKCSSFINAALTLVTVKSGKTMSRNDALSAMMRQAALSFIPQKAFESREPIDIRLTIQGTSDPTDIEKLKKSAFLIKHCSSDFPFQFFVGAVIRMDNGTARLIRKNYPAYPLTREQKRFLTSRIAPVLKYFFPEKMTVIE